jgi:hypothetical protein
MSERHIRSMSHLTSWVQLGPLNCLNIILSPVTSVSRVSARKKIEGTELTGNHQFHSFEKINFFCKDTLELPGIFCDVKPCVWWRHIMHTLYLPGSCSYWFLNCGQSILIFLEIGARYAKMPPWFLHQSINREHSNLWTHVITSISTRWALSRFLHTPLHMTPT